MYICVRFKLKFSTGQVTPKPDSLAQNRTPDDPSYGGDSLTVLAQSANIVQYREYFFRKTKLEVAVKMGWGEVAKPKTEARRAESGGEVLGWSSKPPPHQQMGLGERCKLLQG